jgi:hypothetical protein
MVGRKLNVRILQRLRRRGLTSSMSKRVDALNPGSAVQFVFEERPLGSHETDGFKVRPGQKVSRVNLSRFGEGIIQFLATFLASMLADVSARRPNSARFLPASKRDPRPIFAFA